MAVKVAHTLRKYTAHIRSAQPLCTHGLVVHHRKAMTQPDDHPSPLTLSQIKAELGNTDSLTVHMRCTRSPSCCTNPNM